MAAAAPARSRTEDRQTTILEAAVTVFTRYGYRKTSMDDVAKAANLSRQGLYLHYATKEELFRAALRHALEASLHDAAHALSDASASLEARLVRAFDEWLGRYIGLGEGSASDLAEASSSLLGGMVSEHEARFVEVLTKALRGAGLSAAYKPAGLSAAQLAAVLCATARGLKHTCGSRKAFGEHVAVAVRAICFPLRGAE